MYAAAKQQNSGVTRALERPGTPTQTARYWGRGVRTRPGQTPRLASERCELLCCARRRRWDGSQRRADAKGILRSKKYNNLKRISNILRILQCVAR